MVFSISTASSLAGRFEPLQRAGVCNNAVGGLERLELGMVGVLELDAEVVLLRCLAPDVSGGSAANDLGGGVNDDCSMVMLYGSSLMVRARSCLSCLADTLSSLCPAYVAWSLVVLNESEPSL